MKTLILAIFLFLTASLLFAPAYGVGSESQILTTAHGQITLILDSKLHRALSSKCFKSGSNRPQCDAWRALQAIPRMPQPNKMDQDPGLRLCKNVTGGKLLIGRDAQGNEQGLCEFPDGSMTTTQSLLYHSNRPRQ